MVQEAPRLGDMRDQLSFETLTFAPFDRRLIRADRLSPDEREKLHSRMTDWASLSVQQRNQARLNFAATNKLAPDDKKAQWEAYQALSQEEREKLATGARKLPPGAAPAIKPSSPEKMVVVPKDIARKDGATQPPTNPTLLPRPAGTPPARSN